MASIFRLFKVQVISNFGIGKILNKKGNKLFSGIIGLVVIGLLLGGGIVFTSYTYSDLFAQLLVVNDQLVKLIPLMMALSFMLSLILSFYSTSNIIYGFKDYETLSAMPIKTHQILISKLLLTIIINVIFSILIVVPSFFVYSKFGGTLNANTLINCILMMLFASFLPIAISMVVGVLFLLITSFFRRKNLVQIILYLAFIVAYMAFAFLSSNGSLNPYEPIEKLYFIMPIAVLGVDNILYALLYVGIGLVAFTLVFILVALTYGKVRSRLSVKHTLRNSTLKENNKKSSLSSLFSRECKRFFTCPTYVVNGLFGAFMGIVLAGVMIGLKGQIESILNSILPNSFALVLVLMLCFCFGVAPTSACSISIEGENLWIIRSMPIDIKKVFCAKLLLSCIFNLISAVIVSIVLAIVFRLSVLVSILLILNAILICVCTSLVGLSFNILLPMLHWDTEAQAVKSSVSVLLSILFAFLCCAICVIFMLYVSIDVEITLSILATFFIIVSIISYIFIVKKGEKLLFKKDNK